MGFSDPTIHRVISVDAAVSNHEPPEGAPPNPWVGLEFTEQGVSAPYGLPELGIHFTRQYAAERFYAGVKAARWSDTTPLERACVAAVALGWRYNADQWERPARYSTDTDNPITEETAFDVVKLELGL